MTQIPGPSVKMGVERMRLHPCVQGDRSARASFPGLPLMTGRAMGTRWSLRTRPGLWKHRSHREAFLVFHTQHHTILIDT